MSTNNIAISSGRRTFSIVALNAVSTLAHISQYGLGTMLIPIALEARKAPPEFIGFTSAAFWLGMLAGLVVAEKLIHRLGYRSTVIISVLISAVSFLCIPLLDWHWWPLPSAVIGCGLGLRWIANETWLYRLSPAEAQGRIVGIHEALIGLASIIGPLFIVALGAVHASIFLVAAAVVTSALMPLYIAETISAVDATTYQAGQESTAKFTLPAFAQASIIFWLAFGGLIAGLGGWIENSLLALLPVYITDIGLASSNTAWLFTVLGFGAMVCQFPIGWLADVKGVLWTGKLCALITLLIVIFTLFFGTSLNALVIAMFALGGTTSGLLTLGIIWATQHSTGASLTGHMRKVSIIYTTLSAAGPFVAGFIVSHTNSTSLFWQQLVVVAVLVAVLIKETRIEAGSK